MFKLNYVVIVGSVILVTTRLTSSIASGPSGYPGSASYGGYNQHQHQVQQQQHNPQQQQQDKWYSDASYQNESTISREEAATASTAATSEPTVDREDILLPLPEGWSEHYDPNSGQYYYYNAADGTTSWDKPSPPGVVERGIVIGENKEEGPGSSISVENSPEYEQFNGNTGNTNLNENTTPDQQEQQQLTHDDLTEGSNVITTTGEMVDSLSEVERWQLNHSSESKKPGVDESIKLQQQEKIWESQRQSDHPQANGWNPQMKLNGADENNGSQHEEENWGNMRQSDQVLKWDSSSPPIQKQSEGNKWDQSNSTIPPGDGGEHQDHRNQYQVQPAHIKQQQHEQPGAWGLSQARKDEDQSSQSEPWGVTKSTEHRPQEQPHLPKQQPHLLSDREIQASANDFSSDQRLTQGKWGIPKVTTIQTQPPPGDKHQINDSSLPQKQSWQQQQQHNPQGNHQSPEPQRRSPVQQAHPQQNTHPQQQQYQPSQPPYLQRQQQQHPQSRYDPNTAPGHSQYDQQYGGQNNYGRGYHMQQSLQPQQSSSGMVISQGDDGTSAVKEAFSSTWKGLLGFGNRTREVVGTAREQVVTGATSAGQTLSAKSSSIWETAKSSVGSVFESNDDPVSQQAYSLSGHSQQSQPGNNRPPPGYPGRPTGSDGRGPPSGYPNNITPNYGGRGPPPRNAGLPQHPNGSFGQQPPYGMQPRRDPPYPQPSIQGVGQRGPIQTQYGRQSGPQPNNQGGGQRGPIQTQYGRHAGPQPNNNQGGGQRGTVQTQYARQTGPQHKIQEGVGQRRPPFPGSQLNRGMGQQQGPPQQKQGQPGLPEKQQPDPWDHPGLMGEH